MGRLRKVRGACVCRGLLGNLCVVKRHGCSAKRALSNKRLVMEGLNELSDHALQL